MCTVYVLTCILDEQITKYATLSYSCHVPLQIQPAILTNPTLQLLVNKKLYCIEVPE